MSKRATRTGSPSTAPATWCGCPAPRPRPPLLARVVPRGLAGRAQGDLGRRLARRADPRDGARQAAAPHRERSLGLPPRPAAAVLDRQQRVAPAGAPDLQAGRAHQARRRRPVGLLLRRDRRPLPPGAAHGRARHLRLRAPVPRADPGSGSDHRQPPGARLRAAARERRRRGADRLPGHRHPRGADPRAAPVARRDAQGRRLHVRRRPADPAGRLHRHVLRRARCVAGALHLRRSPHQRRRPRSGPR